MRKVRNVAFILVPASITVAAERLPCEIYPTPGCESTLAQNARRAVQAYGQAVAQKIAFNAKIAASRQQMTLSCKSSRGLRDHPTQAPEAEHFFTLLDEKDIYFLSFTYDPFGMGQQYQTFNEMIEKSTGFGKKLDGGIRPLATFQWDDFINNLNRRLKRGGITSLDGLLGIYTELYSFSKSNDYLRYRIARNIAELNACGCNLTDSAEDLWTALLIVRRPWFGSGGGDDSDQIAHAKEYYSRLSEVYGPDAIRRAAKAVLEAEKNSDGAIISPGGPETSFQAIGRFLGETGPKGFLINALLGWSNPFRPDELSAAGLQYQQLVASYGQPAVDQVAEVLQKTKLNLGEVDNPKALGVQRTTLKAALFDVLANQHPELYVRAVLAFNAHLSTAAAIDGAYKSLVVTYKPEEVIATGKGLVKLWQTPWTLAPSRFARVLQERTREKDPGFDYALLIKILNKKESLPDSARDSTEIVSNPAYLAWSRFKAGETAVYAFKSWSEKDGQVVSAGRAGPSNQPYGGIVEVYRVKSVDPDKAVVEFFDAVLANGRTPELRDDSYVAKVNRDLLKRPPDQPTLVSRTSGPDTIQINGHTYSCTWEKVAYRFPNSSRVITTWTTDAVPGGLVLQREENGGPNGVNIQEKVLQPFSVNSPTMLRLGLPVAFDVSSAQNPASSQEAAKLAERGSADLLKTADGKLPVIPSGTGLKLSLDNSVGASQVEAGVSVIATLTESIFSGRDLLYLKGTKAQVRIQKAYGGMVAITGEQIIRDGQSLSIHTTSFSTVLRNPAESEKQTRSAPPQRPIQTPRVGIGGFGIPGISIPRNTPVQKPQQQAPEIPAGTIISFGIKD